MLNSWRDISRFLAALESNKLTVAFLQFFCLLFSPLHDTNKLQISWHHLHIIQTLNFTDFY